MGIRRGNTEWEREAEGKENTMNTWATLRTERSCNNKRDRRRGFKKMAFKVSVREELGEIWRLFVRKH